jgi:hypothetical protein
MNTFLRRSALSLFIALCLTVSARATDAATSDEASRVRAIAAVKSASVRGPASEGVVATDACTPKPIAVPSTITGTLSSTSCYDDLLDVYEDIYDLPGVAGQTVTIDYSSTNFSVFLWMEGVHVELVSFLSSGVSRQRIVFTFPTTKMYKLEAEALYGPADGQPHTGAYTLQVTTSTSTCTQTASTMCLNNDRFAVSATYSTGSLSGQATAVKLTSDSGYFSFFNTSNIESVVKVLNACGLNSRYWVFAGGLTNVSTTITVRDTKTGTVKTYTNPPNTPFQPIQDTDALAVCP